MRHRIFSAAVRAIDARIYFRFLASHALPHVAVHWLSAVWAFVAPRITSRVSQRGRRVRVVLLSRWLFHTSVLAWLRLSFII